MMSNNDELLLECDAPRAFLVPLRSVLFRSVPFRAVLFLSRFHSIPLSRQLDVPSLVHVRLCTTYNSVTLYAFEIRSPPNGRNDEAFISARRAAESLTSSVPERTRLLTRLQLENRSESP